MVQELSFLTSGLIFLCKWQKIYKSNGLKDMIKDRVSDPITDVVYITGEEEKV